MQECDTSSLVPLFSRVQSSVREAEAEQTQERFFQPHFLQAPGDMLAHEGKLCRLDCKVRFRPRGQEMMHKFIFLSFDLIHFSCLLVPRWAVCPPRNWCGWSTGNQSTRTCIISWWCGKTESTRWSLILWPRKMLGHTRASPATKLGGAPSAWNWKSWVWTPWLDRCAFLPCFRSRHGWNHLLFRKRDEVSSPVLGKAAEHGYSRRNSCQVGMPSTGYAPSCHLLEERQWLNT